MRFAARLVLFTLEFIFCLFLKTRDVGPGRAALATMASESAAMDAVVSASARSR